MFVDSSTLQRNSFLGNIKWTEMGKQKLQVKKVYCLGYAKSFSGRSRKGGKGGGGVQGVHPLLKFTYMTRSRFSETFTRVIYMCKSFIKVTPEMFLIIYRPFGLKLKLLPLKDHTEEAIRELKQQRF